MNDDQIVAKDIKNIFCRRMDNLNRIFITEFNDIATCDGKHSNYIRKARSKMHWYNRFSYTNLAFIIILVLTIIGMCFLRSFNHANTYGGCLTNFFWPFDECPTVF